MEKFLNFVAGLIIFITPLSALIGAGAAGKWLYNNHPLFFWGTFIPSLALVILLLLVLWALLRWDGTLD